MIVKHTEPGDLPSDQRIRAGAAAERQMSFYLNRAFGDESYVCVLNDLRLVDPEQPEHDGRNGVCQIDHLVLHRWGAFLIESKSAVDEVSVRDDGAGGDEWTRSFDGRELGIPSPIQQARRQGDFLRKFLGRHRESLLGKVPRGLRTLFKLLSGSDQRGFRCMPIQIIVAISDHGRIRRVNDWKEPARPFQTFVSKADLVANKIREEIAKHQSAGSLLGPTKGEYGMWCMNAEEVGVVATFLKDSHQPRADLRSRAASPSPPPWVTESPISNPAAVPAPTRPPAPGSHPTCKKCSGPNLTAMWGKFGYYWKCNDCDTNTAMPTVCSACGAERSRGKTVRIRKAGSAYFRACEACGIEERVWTQPAS